MKKFVVKRLLISIVLLFFVSMIIYGIMRCMPASFVETKAMELSQKPGAKSYDEWLQQLNAAYGLDDSVIQGYFVWASKAIRGQFGDSWLYNQPCITEVCQCYLVFLCIRTCFLYSGDHHCDSCRCCGSQKAVFTDRLLYYGYSVDRYIPAQLLLCNDFEVDLCSEA